MRELTDQELLRYSRQIMVADFDVAGQEALLNASALVVGLGGLGSPVALYLAAAGLGKLLLADDDRVDASNLQRQILHSEASVGLTKTQSAAQRISELRADCELSLLTGHLSGESLVQAVQEADLVVDCTDNFATRFELNECSQQAGKPMVFGAAIRMEGQVSVFDPREPESPCYHCLYGSVDREADLSCSQNGVMAPLVGIIGTIQAFEAVRILSGKKSSLIGRLLVLEAASMRWHDLQIRKDPDCPVCGAPTANPP